MKEAQRFDVPADYHQFYLMDAERQPLIPEAVSKADMARRLRIAPNIVVFHTESASRVPVEVEFVEGTPKTTEKWEHEAEFSLSLPSGVAALCGCTEYVPSCPRLEVEPGTYAGKAYFAGTRSSSGERYRVVLWREHGG